MKHQQQTKEEFEQKEPNKGLKLRLGKIRKYHKMTRNVNGLFLDNPIIKFALAMPFLVVGAVSLKHSVCLSLAMIVTVIPLSMLAYFVGDKIPDYLAICVYPILASIILIGVKFLIGFYDPVLIDSLGMYINLIAVSTLLISQINHSSVRKRSFGASTLRSLYTCCGFSLVVISFGLVREIIGSGSVWGIRLEIIKHPAYGAQLAFFGFIMLGFVMALARLITRTIHYVSLKSAEREEE